MKTVLKTTIATLVVLAVWGTNSMAQVKTMYVMRNGEVVFQSLVSGIDSVVFDEITEDDALNICKNDGSSVEKIQLNTIQQLHFIDNNLSIEQSNGNKTYAFVDVAKFLFESTSTSEIKDLSEESGLDVRAYITPEGNVEIETSLPVKSLSLLSVDGRMISNRQYNTAETHQIISLQNVASGIYFLRVGTTRGIITKKILKP